MKRFAFGLVILGACSPAPRYAVCEPSDDGCRVVEIYDDAISCNFATMARNGKDEVRGSYRCEQLPENWR